MLRRSTLLFSCAPLFLCFCSIAQAGASIAAPSPTSVGPATDPEPAAGQQADSPPPPTPDGSRDLPWNVNGLFGINLPQINPPGEFSVQFNPRLADLLHEDYMRLSTGGRWSITHDLELSGSLLFYFDNVFRHGSPGNGVGQVNLGAKRVFRHWPAQNYRTSFEFDTQNPTGHPPLEITDGRNHYTPAFMVECQPKKYPNLITFGGANIDFVTMSSVPGILGENTPGDDSVSFTGGAILDRGQFKWTIQSTFTTTALTGGPSFNAITVQPSVLWLVPRKYTHTRTQFIVGLGLGATWGPDGFDLSTSTRLRVELTFRQALEQLRDMSAFRH
jgi:hypothetical protein